MIDREMLRQHLAKAEEHVLLANKHVGRQRTLIAELERDGHNTAEARKLLEQFVTLQRMHIVARDRLAKELSAETGRWTA